MPVWKRKRCSEGQGDLPKSQANSAGAGPGWGAQGGVRGSGGKGSTQTLSRCPRHTAFSVKLGIRHQSESNWWSLSRV